MVRKRRTELPGSGEASESQEPSGGSGRGVSQPSGARTPIPQQGGGGRSWASGSSQQPQQGGRGGGYYHGRGGGQPRGGMAPQHPGGPPPELQGRGGAQSHGGMVPRQPGGPPPEFQGRGGPRPRGGTPPRQYHGGRRGGGAGSSSSRGSSSFSGPSGPSAPELHQATQAPHQALPPLQSQASSSSQPPEVAIQRQLQQVSIQGESSSSIIIQPATTVVASSKSMRFPLRPGKGSYGDKCVVKANHFFAELPDKDLHQYDVTITPEITSRGVNRAVMEQLVKLYRESHLGGRLPAYDGRKSLYTAGPLPFTSRTFEITLYDEEDGAAGGQRSSIYN